MRRPYLLALSLVVFAAPLAAQGKLVLSIDGDWWDSSGQRLGFASAVHGQCVFGQAGSLQVADSKTKGAQMFLYEKIASQCAASCPPRPSKVPERSRRAEMTVPPPSNIVQSSVLGSFNVGKLFELLVRSPQLYVVAAARGLEDEPLEAVLPVTGSEVDLAAALERMGAGQYEVMLEGINGSAVSTLTGKLSWTQASPAKLTFPQVHPGLYRLNIALEGRRVPMRGCFSVPQPATNQTRRSFVRRSRSPEAGEIRSTQVASARSCAPPCNRWPSGMPGNSLEDAYW